MNYGLTGKFSYTFSNGTNSRTRYGTHINSKR